jgi:HSP20 family molecular chaperone IbpA
MNKNVITLIGFILVAIIGYQGYLLNKSNTPLFETKKDEPKITVNIEKKSIEKEVRELNKHVTTTQQPSTTPTQNNLQNIDPKEVFDEELIKKDMGKLFSDIFGNPKLQEGLKQGMKDMQKQLEEGMKELEKGLGGLSGEMDKLSNGDTFFKDLITGLSQANRLKFTDRGGEYYLKIDVPGGKEANVDIKTTANILTLTITSKSTSDTTNPNSTIHAQAMSTYQNILIIPDDAVIDELKTNYENGALEITVPKKDQVKT